MRYLKYRNDFLKENISIDKIDVVDGIKNSAIINEALENDLSWGDSLLGRLVNSTLRVLKVGYQGAQIPKLLEKLKSEMEGLVTKSFSRDLSEKFNMFCVKNYMEEIKNTCLSTNSENEKLKSLIGFNGADSEWDSDNPNEDTPGWDGEKKRPLDSNDCIMKEIFDNIENEVPNLKDFWGTNRDIFLDNLSNFCDQLRKRTAKIAGGQPGGSTPTPFSVRFGNALNSLAAINASFKINRNFGDFILETEQVGSLKDLKNDAIFLAKKIKDKERDEIVKLNLFSSFKYHFENLNKKEITQLSSVKPEGSDKNLYELLSDLIYGEGKKPTEVTANKQPEKSEEVDKKPTEVTANKQPEKSEEVDKKPKGIQGPKLNTRNNTTQSNSATQSVSESFGMVFESIDDDSDIEDIWKHFFGDWDKNEQHRMTQREVDELEKMMESGENLKSVNFKTDPDPIISIARIFAKAHKLYFVDRIPSGRTGGKVSMQTFRQYRYIGGSSTPRPDEAGSYGPWLVIKNWDNWTDGVMKILDDQKLREVISKITFVVPGAEDKFNPEGTPVKKTESFIFEELDDRGTIGTDKEGLKGKKPHGQIILDFINDMIDEDTQKDFTKNRRKLMKQYFGIEDTTPGEKAVKTSSQSTKKQKVEFVDEQINKFDNSCENQIYMFELEKDNRQTAVGKNAKKQMFVEVISVTSDLTTVRFTFNQHLIANKLMKAKGFNLIDVSKNPGSDVKYLYYGVMKTSFENKELKVVYVDLKDDPPKPLGEPVAGSTYNLKYSSIKILKNMTTSNMVKTDDSVNTEVIGVNAKKRFSELKNLQISRNPIFDELKKKGKEWRFW